jgi:steroid delta-isomerase-like uncharacterized protein
MLELVRRYYAAFNAQEMAKMLELVHPEVEHHVNQGEVRRGKALFEEFLHMMNRHYQEQIDELQIYLAHPEADRAAAEFMVQGRYLVSQEGLPEARGQAYRLPAGAFFAARQGKLTKIVTYYNLPEWIRLVS